MVDTLLRDRYAFLEEVRERLLQAQQYAKHHYDEHHRELSSRWATGCGSVFFTDRRAP